jgi:hypothetical protein
LNIYPNKIYECFWNNNKKCFETLRVRSDKYQPNNVRTALTVWKLIQHNININNILPFVAQEVDDITRWKHRVVFPEWQLTIKKMDTTNEKLIKHNHPIISRFNRQNTKSFHKQEFELRIGTFKADHKFNASVRFVHFQWLRYTLEYMNISMELHHTIDIFEGDYRSTYTDDGRRHYQCTIRKHRQECHDIRDYEAVYEYGLRMSVNTEESSTKQIPYSLSRYYRRKTRYSYILNPYFRLDMTQVTDRSNITSYEIELELIKTGISTSIMNKTLRFVLKSLWGKSEIL